MADFDESFDDFADVESRGTFGGAKMLKFVNDLFVTREGETIGADRKLIATGVEKRVQKFVGKKRIDSIVVPPGERWPDVDAMNEAAPREEWSNDLNGNPRGPYVRVLLLKLVDLISLTRYVFVTQSGGGGAAIGDLADKVRIMRRFRGPGVVPEISLSKTLFSPKFHRNRPDFIVTKWLRFGASDGGSLPPVKPTPELPPANDNTQPASAQAVNDTPRTPPVTTPTQVKIETVEEPSLAEELKDAVPF
jgi:hypothetical protein